MSVTVQDIRKAITEIKRVHNMPTSEVIEAFLINRDDLDELCRWAQDHGQSINDRETGEIRVYGVKMIESPHIPKGTIYKLLKDNLQEYAMGGFGGAGVSGVIPTADPFQSTVAESGSFKIPDCYPVVPESGTIYVPKPSPPPAVPKKPEKKHSSKRRIELD